MNNLKILLLFFLIIGCSTLEKEIPLINAHAHNDYEHERPLFNALENQFISVEVDVHLINDELYVYHDTPIEIDSLKTLELLYLKPLLARINHNKGNVYLGYEGFFYLMIDIKTEAEPSYKKLKDILKHYESMVSMTVNGKEEIDKPIKLVISGHQGRPYNQILEEEPKMASIDGRLKELGLGIPKSIMPYISENYKNYFSYSGEGTPTEKDIEMLIDLSDRAHKEEKKLRFWASPDNENVWNFLLDHNVDLINTDSLPKFNKYMSKRMN
jgi:hypothetical protein